MSYGPPPRRGSFRASASGELRPSSVSRIFFAVWLDTASWSLPLAGRAFTVCRTGGSYMYVRVCCVSVCDVWVCVTCECVIQMGWYSKLHSCRHQLANVFSSKLASFPGHLLLCSLDRIRDLWTASRSGRRAGTSSTCMSSNCKVDSIMTYVDSVSVIMATCPRTLLHVLASTTEKSTN